MAGRHLRAGDAQCPDRLILEMTHGNGRGYGLGSDAAAMAQIDLSGARHADMPGGTVQEPQSEPRLQLSDALADRGLWHPEP